MQAQIPSSQVSQTSNLFATHLTPNPQSVLTISTQHLTQLSSFTQAFRQQYAKNLSSVSSLLNKYIDPDSNKAISFVCSAWKVENQQRAQQANQLAETLRCEVYERLVEVKEAIEEKIKAMEKDIKRYTKEQKTLSDKVSKAYRQYQSRSQSLQQNRIYRTYLSLSNTLPEQKKALRLQKLTSQITSTHSLHTSYHSTLTQYNTFITQYQTHIKTSFSILQQNIRQSLTLETDSLRKLIVGEVSMFKNIEYDLISISKQMEEVSGEKDLEQEVEKGRGKTSRVFQAKSNEVEHSLIDHSLGMVENKALGQFQQLQADYNFVTILQHRHKQLNRSNAQINTQINSQLNQTQQPQLQTPTCLFTNLLASSSGTLKHLTTQPTQLQQNFNLLTQYISQILNNKEVTSIKPPKKHTKKGQSNTPLTYIKKLFNASHFYRISACAFVKMSIGNKQTIEDDNQIKLIANFINTLITKSSKHYDVIVLRQLLPMLFQLQFMSTKTKRPFYLHSLVNKNFLWKRQDFWEAAIYEDIYQAMSLTNAQGQATGIQSKIEKEQQDISSILKKYSKYMVMFGIGQKDVKVILGKFIKLCEVTEVRVKEIDNVIEQVNKEYKELASVIAGQKRQRKVLTVEKGEQ